MRKSNYLNNAKSVTWDPTGIIWQEKRGPCRASEHHDGVGFLLNISTVGGRVSDGFALSIVKGHSSITLGFTENTDLLNNFLSLVMGQLVILRRNYNMKHVTGKLCSRNVLLQL